MSSRGAYDFAGERGVDNFKALPPGLRLELVGGAVAEIVENAGDGAVVMVRVVEDATFPERVGEEEAVFYRDVVVAT